MVIRTRDALIRLFIIVAAFFVFGTRLAEAHEENVHSAITEKAIDYLIRERPELKACGLPLVRQSLDLGVQHEDDDINWPMGRFLFHFYPEALNDDFKFAGRQFGARVSCDAAEWGFNSFDGPRCYGTVSQLPENGLPLPNPLSKSIILHQDYGYNDMIKLGLHGLQKTGTDKFAGLVGLGHFLHLLQDLTSPAHVRNDAHPHKKFSFDVLDFGDPSKLEELISEELNFDQNLSLDSPLVVSPTKPLETITDAKSAFATLAAWTAANFHSERDLLLQNPIGTLGPDGYLYDSSNPPRMLAYRDPLQSFISNITKGKDTYTINDRVAQVQFRELGSEAARWTASMIKFIHENVATVCEEELSVTVAGNGSVTSLPNGISCGTSCEFFFPAGKTVTLTAQAGNGQTFKGWDGAPDVIKQCFGSTERTCVLTMDDDAVKKITALFSTSGPYWRGTYTFQTWEGEVPLPDTFKSCQHSPQGFWTWQNPCNAYLPLPATGGGFYFDDQSPDVVFEAGSGPRNIAANLNWRSSAPSFTYTIPTAYSQTVVTGGIIGRVEGSGDLRYTFSVTTRTPFLISGTFTATMTSGYFDSSLHWFTPSIKATGTWSASLVGGPKPQPQMHGFDFCFFSNTGFKQMDIPTSGCNPSEMPGFCAAPVPNGCRFQ